MKNQNRNPVSPSFYQFILSKTEEAEKELNDLQEDIRRLTNLGCLGDEYDAQPELSLEWQLQDALWRAKDELRSCVVVPGPKDNFQVQIGSRIELLFGNHKQIVRLEGIGGRSDICSLQTPLGREIFGAKVGDTFMNGGKEIKINQIFL